MTDFSALLLAIVALHATVVGGLLLHGRGFWRRYCRELAGKCDDLAAERDAAIARAEKAEAERDEARMGLESFGAIDREEQAEYARMKAELDSVRLGVAPEPETVLTAWGPVDLDAEFECMPMTTPR